MALPVSSLAVLSIGDLPGPNDPTPARAIDAPVEAAQRRPDLELAALQILGVSPATALAWVCRWFDVDTKPFGVLQDIADPDSTWQSAHTHRLPLDDRFRAPSGPALVVLAALFRLAFRDRGDALLTHLTAVIVHPVHHRSMQVVPLDDRPRLTPRRFSRPLSTYLTRCSTRTDVRFIPFLARGLPGVILGALFMLLGPLLPLAVTWLLLGPWEALAFAPFLIVGHARHFPANLDAAAWNSSGPDDGRPFTGPARHLLHRCLPKARLSAWTAIAMAGIPLTVHVLRTGLLDPDPALTLAGLHGGLFLVAWCTWIAAVFGPPAVRLINDPLRKPRELRNAWRTTGRDRVADAFETLLELIGEGIDDALTKLRR